jgi:hypothetical protein
LSASSTSTPAAGSDISESGFRLVSIRSTAAPSGSAGQDWFAYCIAQGTNLINGYRRGDLADVTVGVENIVAALNERRVGKRGRVDLKPSRPAPPPSGT